MSLINDALKKAEREREERPDRVILEPTRPPVAPARRRRGWRYLRGFFISLLIVGTLTTVTTSYLVNQLLKEPGAEPDLVERLTAAIRKPKTEESRVEGPQESTRAPDPVTSPLAAPPIAPIAMAQKTVEQVQASAQDALQSVPNSIDQTKAILSVSEPVATLSDETHEGQTGLSVENDGAEPSAPESPAPLPPIDPGAVMRAFADSLSGLEVRGLMQANGRVLIYDSLSGKTRTYSVGDSLEGHPDCTILSIEGKSVIIGGPDALQHSLQF